MLGKFLSLLWLVAPGLALTAAPFAESVRSLVPRNYTGYVIDADANAGNPPGFNRDAIRIETVLRFINTNAAPDTNIYTFSYRLLTSAAIAQPIRAIGSNVANATFTYAPRQVVALAAGATNTVTNVAVIHPLVHLDPHDTYTVEMRLLRNGNNTTVRASDGPRTYLHFTNLVASDAALNVIATLNSLTPVREFAVRTSTEGKRSFQAEAEVTLVRYDAFTNAAPATTAIPVLFQTRILDSIGGGQVLLQASSSIASTNVPEFVAGARPEPASVTFRQVLDFEPAVGAQLDSLAARYRFRVQLFHSNAVNQLLLDNAISTTNRQLLHFNGALTFGGVDSTFTQIDNTPLPGALSGSGVLTTLGVANNSGRVVARTNMTFGNGTDLAVRLLTNGTAELVSGSVPVTVPGTNSVGNGFAVSLGNTGALGTNGLTGSIVLTPPSGFGYRTGNRNQPFTHARLTNASAALSVRTLIPSNAVDFLPGSGRFFCHEESKPLWFETDKITWAPGAGTLSLVALDVHHVRSDAYADLLGNTNNAVGGLSGIRKPSNDRYWEFVDRVTSPSVTFSADARGRAQATFDVQFTAPATFEAHFPADVSIGWSGNARLSVSNDLVVWGTASTLFGVSNIVVEHVVGCQDCGLVVLGSLGEMATREMNFVLPLAFTQEGGLVGIGNSVLFSGDTNNPLADLSLGWGKSDGLVTHQVNNILAGTFHMPGNFLETAAITDDDANRPGILLLTGVNVLNGRPLAQPFENTTNQLGEVVVSGNAAYNIGLGEYAGLNFLPSGGGTNRAGSRIAGEVVFFDPSIREKLYVRKSGVSGIHEGTGTITLNDVYGYDFAISNLSLSFLNGKNVASALAGGLTVPWPANFTYRLDQIRLRCNGHFEDAPPSRTQPGVILDYWDTPVQINGVTFERVATGTEPFEWLTSCASDEYRVTFDVFLRPTNRFLLGLSDGFTGRLAFSPDGNIEPPSAGISGVSGRLSGPSALEIAGAGGDNFTFEPVCDAYLNTWKSSYGTNPTTPGWMNLAGTLNVAFFEDLKVHLQFSPGLNAGTLHLMGGWPASGFTSDADYWNVSGSDYFNDEDFDGDNEGKPSSVSITNYRDALTEDYNPRAQKEWSVLKFDYPLSYSSSGGEFTVLEPKEKNLIILKTLSRLDHLRASSADLAFRVSFNTLPVANLTEMILEETELNEALAANFAVHLASLDKGLGRLGDVLDSDPHKFWDPLLDQLLDPVLNDLYAELERVYAQVDPCDFVTEARPIIDRYVKGVNNEANSVAAKLRTAAGTFDQAASVLGQTYDYLGDVDIALAAFVGEDVELRPDGEVAGYYAGILFEEGVDAAYPARKRQKAKEFATDLIAKLGGMAVDIAVQELVEEYLSEVDLPLDGIGVTLRDLRVQLSDIRDRLKPARDYALQMEAILNAAAAEAQSIADLTSEDTLDYLESFACGLDDPFLDVAEDVFKNQLKEFIKDRFYATGLPYSVQNLLKEILYDLNSVFVEAANAGIAELNRVAERVLGDLTVNLGASLFGLEGDVGIPLAAGSFKGDAHIIGDSLQELLLDAELKISLGKKEEGDDPNSTEDEGSAFRIGAQFALRNYDNDGDAGTCEYGASPTGATEVALNIEAQAAGFLSDNFQFQANMLFAFTTDPNRDPAFRPLQVGGGFQVPVIIPIIPGLIEIRELGGDVSFGLKENFISGNGTITVIQVADVRGGMFIGKTCSYEVFDDWAPDVRNVIGLSDDVIERDGWAGLYQECSYSVGIGASCFLRAEYGAGFGYGFSWSELQLLGRMFGWVDGDFLCLLHGGANIQLNVRGNLGDLLGGNLFGALWLQGCAEVEARAVIIPFSKEVCITYENGSFSASED
jgi:hypothetical protein